MDNNIEERLKNVTIGEREALNNTIYLEEYNRLWISQFEQLKQNIIAVLGTSIKKLEHVGSTSIVGIMAKPIIDMVLEVEDSSNESLYIPQLEAIGYILRIREPEWFEHRLLKAPIIKGNLHVFSQGCKESARMLLFREWLNTHPDDKELYQRTKQELSKRTWKYTQEYADAKSEVVLDILNRALKNHYL